MSFTTYNQNTPLQFFDKDRLLAERTIIDNYVHDIVKNYGMDVLYVSQKKNFPVIPEANKVSQQNILFHAYGDHIKPDYNDPFLTRVYIKFENDLFAINQFGLSNDMTATLFFSKIDFAFDGAIALADNETITKKFTFTSTINADTVNCRVAYEDKTTKFKIAFPFTESNDKQKRVAGEVETFEIAPANIVGNEYIVASFTRRYSAKNHVNDSNISVSYKTQDKNEAANQITVTGTITCSFNVKNPYKPYAKFERRITPAVGDIVFIQSVDDKFEKLEITEVVAENKTVSGINPLLATYAYQCACKPFIADNATDTTDIAAATPININKLEAIEFLSNNASTTADHISNYDSLYKDYNLGDVKQDMVYGGYGFDSTVEFDTSSVPMETELVSQTFQTHFKWQMFGNTQFKLTLGSTVYTVNADELYVRLSNLFNYEYVDAIIKANNLPDVDYSMFKLDEADNYVEALNCTFYLDGDYGYLAHIKMLNMIKDDPTLLTDFRNSNPELITYINASYIKGYKSSDNLPYLDDVMATDYDRLLADKRPSNLVQVTGDKYTKHSVDDIVTYTTDGTKDIIVDLRDVESRNINTLKFKELLDDANKQENEKVPTSGKIDAKFIKGELVTVFAFGDDQRTRLATNGLDLFLESHDSLGLLYRGLIRTTLRDTDQIKLKQSRTYNDKTVSLRSDLSWLTGDQHGICFNPVSGHKHVLAGSVKNSETKLSYKYDITAQPNSTLITFKSSPFYIKLTQSLTDISLTTDKTELQYLYIPDLLTGEQPIL